MTVGVSAWGTYLPLHRLDRRQIGDVLGPPSGRGTRTVASYDQDALSLAVEAGRQAIAVDTDRIGRLLYSTTSPVYLDKTNATTIHAALGLPATVGAYDLMGSVRSGTGALLAAASSAGGATTAVAVAGDVRTGRPGGQDERSGGDGAAALVFAEGADVAAELVATSSRSAEFLDRWRTPGDVASHVWEERFGEHVYVPLGLSALEDALKGAGLTADSIDHLVVSGTHRRATRAIAASAGVRDDAVGDDLVDRTGFCGSAHAALLLADTLEESGPDEVIALVGLGDGADVLIFRTTAAVASCRPSLTVRAQLEAGRPVDYASFLTWRGMLRREPPRRPEPDRPAAPPSHRTEEWKFGFTGSRCSACGAVHLPPARVCGGCGLADSMRPARLADVPATVATYSIDHLAYSMAPPVVTAVIDFDGGGRRQCELTDLDPSEVSVGMRVGMTFRRLYTADGVANYHWKARPQRAGEEVH